MKFSFKTIVAYIAVAIGLIGLWAVTIVCNQFYWSFVEKSWSQLHYSPTSIVAMAHPVLLALFGIFLSLGSTVFLSCITFGTLAGIGKNITVRGLG